MTNVITRVWNFVTLAISILVMACLAVPATRCQKR